MPTNVVTPAGRLDSLTAPEFLKMVNAATGPGVTGLVMDLAEVPYVSSAGLRVILIAAKMLAAQGGRLALCGLGAQVAEVFALSRFDVIANLSLHADRADALRALA